MPHWEDEGHNIPDDRDTRDPYDEQLYARAEQIKELWFGAQYDLKTVYALFSSMDEDLPSPADQNIQDPILTWSDGFDWQYFTAVKHSIKSAKSSIKYITGKYLFFSDNKELLIDIALREIHDYGFAHAKISLYPSEDYVLCLYFADDSRKRELADRYAETQVKYRWWKSDMQSLIDAVNKVKKYHAIGHCTRLTNVYCPHCGRETVCNHDGLDIQFCFSCYKRADMGTWYACDLLTYYFKQDQRAPIGYIMLDGSFERIRSIEPASGVYDEYDFDILTYSGKRAFAYDGTVVRVGVI